MMSIIYLSVAGYAIAIEKCDVFNTLGSLSLEWSKSTSAFHSDSTSHKTCFLRASRASNSMGLTFAFKKVTCISMTFASLA